MSPADIEKFRIETFTDPETHLYSATIYYPMNSPTPVAQTACIFTTEEDAQVAVREMINAVFTQPQQAICSS